jgi:hypothetical protein
MGRCSGTSRIYWVCKYSKPLAMKKEAVNKKTRRRYAKEKRAPKTANAITSSKSSQVRILGHIKTAQL